jgi:hypothetical protein
MTDESRLNENDEQQDEVEGHQFRGAAAEPHLAPGLAHDDSDDDVEGHMKLSEPKL